MSYVRIVGLVSALLIASCSQSEVHSESVEKRVAEAISVILGEQHIYGPAVIPVEFSNDHSYSEKYGTYHTYSNDVRPGYPFSAFYFDRAFLSAYFSKTGEGEIIAQELIDGLIERDFSELDLYVIKNMILNEV
ncbi:MAG: hypothetical protein AAFY10_13720 [Pseudomonadota bacterium]